MIDEIECGAASSAAPPSEKNNAGVGIRPRDVFARVLEAQTDPAAKEILAILDGANMY